MFSPERSGRYLGGARPIQAPGHLEMRREPPKRFRELEKAIDDVVASYTGELEIDNLESAALPNKRLVVEGFEHLKSALFMGFYAMGSLSKENLRHVVAEHLYRAYQLLVEQIERALTYRH